MNNRVETFSDGCPVTIYEDQFESAAAPPEQGRKFIGYISLGCGKHPRNAQGAHTYKLDCLDCQKQPMIAWFEGEPPTGAARSLAGDEDKNKP